MHNLKRKQKQGETVKGTEEHKTQIKCCSIKNTVKNQNQKSLWTQRRSPHSVAKAAAGESLFPRWLSCHSNVTWKWEMNISGVSFKVYSSPKDLHLQISSKLPIKFQNLNFGEGEHHHSTHCISSRGNVNQNHKKSLAAYWGNQDSENLYHGRQYKWGREKRESSWGYLEL